ncbi:LysR substrate-binding domain-containing protein [Bordetella petrii]|uniref:Transcriptional regulator, LysR-family n=1 Tax=Bordetella petrii (strain ATCC BAA-461 / DSM 12804 / CCUG 43448 / CIP 107267 / Se-1111R) TaxID=340100 RepID=A9IDQ4_BORPD|nr:LysR substrate-binding domain-containing protein [Bordetella petrii]CAP41590.1 transcriptional regulator, LysR-family [Bordetella petrii]
MDLRQLRYFTRIVEVGSISAAADVLYTAQPSLSKHVANLEAELGIQLLVRNASGTQPTPTGQILYRHAKIMLRQLEETRAALNHGRDVPSGCVSVGLPTSTARIFAMPLLARVREQFPEVTIAFVDGSTFDLGQAVISQQLDMAITTELYAHSNIQVIPLFEEELFLFGQQGLMPDASPASLDELATLPFILPKFPNSVRSLLTKLMASANKELRLVAESSAADIMLAAARQGLAHTVLPWCALAGGPDIPAKLSVRSITGAGLQRQVMLCVSNASQNSLAGTVVRQIILELIYTLVNERQWHGVRLTLPAS